MKKALTTFITLIKKSLAYPFLWVGVTYLIWFVLLPVSIEKNFTFGIRWLGVYFVIAVLEKLLGGNKILSILLFLVLAPIAFFAGWLLLNILVETLGWLGREFVYVPLILLFSGYAAHNLYKTPPSNNKILRILLFIITLPILSSNVAYSVTYFPNVDDRKDVRSEMYYLVWTLDFDAHSYITLYYCQKWSIKCESLYRTYTDMYIDKIIFDKEKNEVSIIDGDYDLGLAFTYGDNPRSYEKFSVQLRDHSYQVSEKHDSGSCGTTDCDIFTYTLYECNLDYTSCDMLPIQYRTTSDRWIYLEVNETANAINAYDDNALIFTYGEHSICYVSGCVILD